MEVCLDGFWATVCEEGWDDEDALIVCRQLGLPPAGSCVSINSTYSIIKGF